MKCIRDYFQFISAIQGPILNSFAFGKATGQGQYFCSESFHMIKQRKKTKMTEKK